MENTFGDSGDIRGCHGFFRCPMGSLSRDFLRSLHRDGWGIIFYDLHWSNYLTLFQPHLLGILGTAGYKGDYPDFIFNNLYLLNRAPGAFHRPFLLP